MADATPEQNKEFRQIGFVTMIVGLATFGVVVTVAIIAHLFGDAFTLLGVLAVTAFYLIFLSTYWRCPVCKQTWFLGSSYFWSWRCRRCDTVFRWAKP